MKENTEANMKIKRIKRIGIKFLSLILFGSIAWAAENTGNQAMPLMWEGGTARAMSMGSAVVAVPQESASLFWNPAGLGLMQVCPGETRFGDGMELGVHHNSGLGDTIQETAVIGIPMGSLGGFAASLNYVTNGTFEGRDEFGVKSDDYTVGDMGGSLGWGKQWFQGISAGIAVKYNRQTIATTSYNAYAADIGLLWNAFDRFNLGVTYSNLGSKVAEYILDSGVRVGASYGINKDVLVAASGEVKQPSGGFDRVQMGVEGWFHPRMALRAGYLHNFSDQKLENFSLTGLTAGIGIKILKQLTFDYAYLPSGDLGISQRLSLTYKFPCKKRVVKAQPKPVPVAQVIPVPKDEPIVIILDKIVILEDGHFEHDSATLTKNGAIAVIDNAQILKDNPKANIRVAGYSSAAGTEEYNQKLSERRAKSVEAILINVGGVAPERLTTIGYGEMRPAMYEAIPSNIHSAAAKANKRVLFEVMTKPQ